MAEVQLRYGSDPANRQLAVEIIQHQQAEIDQMHAWLRAHKVRPGGVLAVRSFCLCLPRCTIDLPPPMGPD